MEREYRLRKEIREVEENDRFRGSLLEERAVREFGDYANEEMIRYAYNHFGHNGINSLYSIREALIQAGVEGIPFKTYRKDNDPGRE